MMTIDEKNEAATFLVVNEQKHTREEINQWNFPLLLYTFGDLKTHNTTNHSILRMQVS